MHFRGLQGWRLDGPVARIGQKANAPHPPGYSTLVLCCCTTGTNTEAVPTLPDSEVIVEVSSLLVDMLVGTDILLTLLRALGKR